MRSYSAENVSLEECKAAFEKLLKSTKRDGVEKLLEFLEKTDFYTAPASTKFHESREGGLLRHSLNVYARMLNEFSNEQKLKPENDRITDEDALRKVIDSIAIVALLHDLCKYDMYVIDTKSKKQEDGSWEKVPFYTMNNKRLPYGHGEKSVYIASGFIRLTRDEAIAIRFHMGGFEGEIGRETGLAFENYELAMLLHVADIKATYLDEGGTNFGT